MESFSYWLGEFKTILSRVWEKFLNFAPSIIEAFALIVLGLLVGYLFKYLSLRLSKGINLLLDRILKKGFFVRIRLSPSFIDLFSKVVFWAVFLFFATAAAQILGLEAFSIWLNRVVAYIPTLLVGGLIIVAGIILSAFARDFTTSALASAEIPHNKLIGGIVQGVTLITAIVIGLDQIGIEVTFLVIIISVFLGTLFGSFTLAMALGSRDLIGNLIGVHYLQQQYQLGQKIKLGDIVGTILEFTPLSVVLSTEEGRMTVPGKTFHNQPSLLYMQDLRDE